MINQLAELHEIAPDVCEYTSSKFPEFVIAGYGFWQAVNGELIACPVLDGHFLIGKNVGGRPALAWLCDAMEQVIARWDFEYRFFSSVDTTLVGDTKAAALLSALIAALKADQ